MSVLLAAVATVTPAVQAVVSSPTPVPTVLDTVNSVAKGVSQTDIILVASSIAVAIQAAINKVPFFSHTVEYVQNVRRFLLAVFIPGAIAVGTSLATGNNDLGLMPVVFLLAQVVFYVFKTLYGFAQAKLMKAVGL